MFHCYHPSSPPPYCHLEPSHFSLISLVRTRSNYSAVLTMRNNSLVALHQKKKEKKKQLFRNQSMDEIKRVEGLNAVGGAIEEGMCRVVRSISIDVPLLEGEKKRELKAYFEGVVILSSLPGSHPPELSAPQKELPDSTESDTSPELCITPLAVHQSSCLLHSDVIDLSPAKTGTGTGENCDKGKNDDVEGGEKMAVTDYSCDLQERGRCEKNKRKKNLRKLKGLMCCTRGVKDD